MRPVTRIGSVGTGGLKFLSALFFVALTGTASGQAGEPGTLKWSFETRGWMTPPSIGVDGTIYVGSGDGNLYALTPEGKLQWKYRTDGWITASAAVGADGTIYAGSQDGRLHALTPDGKRKWVFRARDIFSTPALGPDGTIYVGNRDLSLYALSPDGKPKWSVRFKSDRSSAPTSPAVGADGTVYFGGGDNVLYAFSPDGKRQWAVPTAGGDGVTSPAIGADGTIYVANGASEFGRIPAGAVFTLHAITPDGMVKWTFETRRSAPFPSYSPVIGPNGTIYYAAHRLHAISPDGKELWAYRDGGFTFSPPSVGADGTVYLNTRSALYALTASGALRWKADTRGQGGAFPVLGTQGVVYVATDAGAVDSRWGDSTNHLLAIQASSRGYADGPWSSYQARWLKNGSRAESSPLPSADPFAPARGEFQ